MRQEKGNSVCLGKRLLRPDCRAKHVLVLQMQTRACLGCSHVPKNCNQAALSVCRMHERPPVQYLCMHKPWLVCVRLPLTHSFITDQPLGPPEERSECSGCAGAGSGQMCRFCTLSETEHLSLSCACYIYLLALSSVVQSATLGPEWLAANKISSPASYKSILIPPRRLVRHAGSPVFLHHSLACS